MNRPIGIDLFAGAGGMSLGFEQAGFDIVAAVEIDPIHCATHEYNFPEAATICASVIDLSGDEIRRIAKLGDRDIDVVFGGAPCQGFSLMGKRVFDDPRNQLVFHYVRIVRELNPKYCVFENVKGLTLGKHAQFLDELIAALGDAGYDVLTPYRVLNAADYGVPQDRLRLFLVGTRHGLKSPNYPEPKHSRITVQDAIGDLPNADSFDLLNHTDSVSFKWETTSLYARKLRGFDADPDDYSYPRKFSIDLLTCSSRTEHTKSSRTRFEATLPGKTESISRFRKLEPDGICNTLRAGTDSARGAHTSPRPIHPFFARVITVREAARLHSYPDWFRLHSTKWHGCRQIGNSVPPLLARAVASEIIKAQEIKPSKPKKALDLGENRLLSLDMSNASTYFKVPRDTIGQRTRKISQQSQDKLVSKAIDSYEIFKSIALETYHRLNRDFNLDDLVPIYRIRRDIGDRIKRQDFNLWLLQMQADDIFQLQGGSVSDGDPQKIEDSITTELSGLRCYATLLNT